MFADWISRKLPPESHDLLHTDLLRFVAASGIVWLHYVQKVDGGPLWVTIRTSSDRLALLVDLFFAVSGYVIAFVYFERINSRSDYLAFMRNRFGRLVPLHWLTLAFSATLGLAIALHLTKAETPETYDFHCVVTNLLLLHATGLCSHLSFNGPSWSISAEFCMYALTPLFFLASRRGRPVAVVMWLVALLAVSILLSDGRSWYERTADFGYLRALPSFLFGIALFRYRDALQRVPHASALMLGMLTLFSVLLFAGAPGPLLVGEIYVIVALAVAADGNPAPRLVRKLAGLGQLTYSSYMIHEPVLIVGVTFVGQHVFHLHGAPMTLLVVATALAVLPLSYLSLVCFERPMREWVRNPRRSRLTRQATSSL